MQRRTIKVAEAAEYIGVSKDTIYKLVRKQEIPHIRLGKRILFRVESLEAWLQEREAGPEDTQPEDKPEYGQLRMIKP